MYVTFGVGFAVVGTGVGSSVVATIVGSSVGTGVGSTVGSVPPVTRITTGTCITDWIAPDTGVINEMLHR